MDSDAQSGACSGMHLRHGRWGPMPGMSGPDLQRELKLRRQGILPSHRIMSVDTLVQ